MKKLFVLSFVAAIALSATIIMAQGANQQMSIQGRLTDAAGKPLDGTYVVKFDLYDIETGGSSLWNEIQSLTVTKGLFQTRLGSGTAFPVGVKFDKPYYVGITVNNEALSPRYVLAASPYSLNPAATVASRSIGRDQLLNPYVTMKFIYDTQGQDHMTVTNPLPGSNPRCICDVEISSVQQTCQCNTHGGASNTFWITVWDKDGNLVHGCPTCNLVEAIVVAQVD